MPSVSVCSSVYQSPLAAKRNFTRRSGILNHPHLASCPRAFTIPIGNNPELLVETNPMPEVTRAFPQPSPAFEPLETRRLMAAPEIGVIANQSIPADKTLFVPIATTYDGSDRVRYSVQTTRAVVEAEFMPGSNTWIRIDTNFGAMDLQLFDDLATNTVDRMLGLIKAGFFDGLTFHRVVPNFVIQGGDPNGDGSGGPGFSFSDEFNSESLFTGDGQLAMANNGKDTNGSQFFITTIAAQTSQSDGGPPRFLDFNHTIWGQLVRGSAVRDAIINTPQQLDDDTNQPNGSPVDTVRINNISIVKNRTDAVLVLRSTGKITASNADRGTVTITARTNDGTATQTFRIAGNQNATDDPAILGPIDDMTTPKNRTLRFSLTGQDIDADDEVSFAAEMLDTSLGTVTTDGSRVTFIPATGYTGPADIRVGVRQVGSQGRGSSNNPFDFQVIRIGVSDAPAVGTGRTQLSAAAGTGSPGMVVATFIDTDPAGAPANWTASINWGDGVISNGRLSQAADGTFSVTGNHEYKNAADGYPVEVTINGDRGAREMVNSIVNARDIATLSSTGTLIVNGSSGNDSIALTIVGGKAQASVNGVTKRFNLSAVKRLQIAGYEGDDAITVNVRSRSAMIDAGAGDDMIATSDGNDVLLGGSGRDRITAGAGDDTLAGGASRDILNGGGGTDTAFASTDDERIAIEVLA